VIKTFKFNCKNIDSCLIIRIFAANINNIYQLFRQKLNEDDKNAI